MKQPNLHIDESIKIDNFNSSPPYHEDVAHQLFQKYAQNPNLQPVSYEPIEELRQIGTEQSQVKGLQTGFRKLKFEQIEKLKDLRSEYEQIKKITTDYVTPKASKASSLHSSSRLSSEPATQQQQLSKVNQTGGRELQILELEKKRLEGMVENSMRKIQELLHNQMEYKKVIHELKLQNQNKSQTESDVSYRLLRKKEKEYSQEMRILQLQRETLLSSTSSHKEKIKYLQSSLANCEQQLRKMLDEKRNYDQLIRMEKDKYMNLEIQFRREKREHQIMEKDKNAEINRLLKLKDIHDESSDKQLRNALAALHDEVKLKDKRYALLLDQFQTFQKERIREEKQAEVKIITDLLAKNPVDSQSKILQETISGIMNRLKDLEKKPVFEIDDVISPKINEPFHLQQEFEQKISEFNRSLQQKTAENNKLSTENQYLQQEVERLEREVKILQQNQSDLNETIERLKKSLKKNKREKSQGDLEVRLASQTNLENTNASLKRDYESQVQLERKEKAILAAELQSVNNQNRALRQQIGKLQFQVEKKSKEVQFQSDLHLKAHQAELQILHKQISVLQQSLRKSQYENNEAQQQFERILQSRAGQIQDLRNTISDLQKVRKENQQINGVTNELSYKLKALSQQNRNLQQRSQYTIALERQNDELRRLLLKTRRVNTETDDLWSQKETEYTKIDQILRLMN